jgi:hypothetical protein
VIAHQRLAGEFQEDASVRRFGVGGHEKGL